MGNYANAEEILQHSSSHLVAEGASIDPRRDTLRRQVGRGSSEIDGCIVDNQSFRQVETSLLYKI